MWRLVVLVLIVTLFPLLIYVSLASELSYRSLVDAVSGSLERQCVLVARDINRFVAQRVSNARVVSQADVLEGDDAEAIQQYVDEVAAADDAIDNVTVTHLDGRVLAGGGMRQVASGEHWQSASPRDDIVEQLFEKTLTAQQGDVFVSDAVKGNNGASILLLTPVTDDSNMTVVKVLILEMQLQRVQAIVSEFDDSVLGDKSVYLVDNIGRVVTSRDDSVGILDMFPDLQAEPDLAVRFSSQGEVGNLIYHDNVGDEVIAGYADLAEFGKNEGLDWSIIAIAPLDDVTVDARSTRNQLLLTGSALIGLSLLLTITFGRNITRPLQRIVEAADEFRDGRFDVRLEPDRTREIDAIAAAFNAMAVTIQTRTRELVQAQSRAMLGSWEMFPGEKRGNWSEEMYALFDRDQTAGVPDFSEFMEMLHPEDRSHIAARYSDLPAPGTSWTSEFRSNPEHGPIQYFIGTAECLERDGQIVIVGTTQDVTARAVAERKLRESEEQYRLLTEAAFDGVVVIDDGKIVDANPSFLQMFDFTLEELQGRTPEAITARESAAIAQQHIRDRFEEIYEIVGERKDGTRINVEVLGRNIVRNGRPGRVTAMRDVTAKRRAEREQKKLHARNAALVEALGEIVVEWDAETQDVTWSGDVESILGYSLASIGSSRASARELVHPDDLPGLAEAVGNSFKTGQALDVEFRLKHSDGRYVWCHERAVRQHEEAAGQVRFIGVLRDVTERRELTEELRVLNVVLEQRVSERTSELQQANDDLEAYAHSVAHDLRAPLRAMYGFSKALREDYDEKLDDDGREYIEFIESAARQMDELIQDLLEYSKVGQGEMSIDPVDLDDVVERSLKQVKADLDLRNPRLTVARPLGRVIGHRSTLVQVMSNLVSNATKFVENDVTPDVRIWSQDQDGCVRLWVEDNGIGIDSEFQARIFRVFERLHGIETYPGTGIGLAIVRRAIESMNGRVGVESAPGEGSRFWVELPSATKHKTS